MDYKEVEMNEMNEIGDKANLSSLIILFIIILFPRFCVSFEIINSSVQIRLTAHSDVKNGREKIRSIEKIKVALKQPDLPFPEKVVIYLEIPIR